MCGLQSAVTVLGGLTLFGGFSQLQALAEGLAKDGIKIDVGGDLRAVGAIVGLFAMAEWLVIALSRQHHDALSTSVAERFALPIEEEVRSPRVKLDVRWVLTRMKRKTQGAVVLLISALPGLFFLVLLDALSGLPDLFDAMAASGNIHLDGVLRCV